MYSKELAVLYSVCYFSSDAFIAFSNSNNTTLSLNITNALILISTFIFYQLMIYISSDFIYLVNILANLIGIITVVFPLISSKHYTIGLIILYYRTIIFTESFDIFNIGVYNFTLTATMIYDDLLSIICITTNREIIGQLLILNSTLISIAPGYCAILCLTSGMLNSIAYFNIFGFNEQTVMMVAAIIMISMFRYICFMTINY